MWAHQYLQQPNAVAAAVQQDHFWHNDGPDATTMNLEPNFPCCTGNFNQGWPKFVTNMAVTAAPRTNLTRLSKRKSDSPRGDLARQTNGHQHAAATDADALHSLVLGMLAPCSISTVLGGGTVTVNVTTSYPVRSQAIQKVYDHRSQAIHRKQDRFLV